MKPFSYSIIFGKSILRSVVFLWVFCPLFSQNVIYVDNQLSVPCNGTYSVSNRDCSGNDGDAYPTFAGATTVAVAGTEVRIRGGSYSEQLAPQHSGNASNPVVFKNHNNEVVEITGSSLSPAIWMEEKDYIVIEGLEIRNVRRWLNALGSDYLTLKNNTFENALDPYGSSKTGVFLQYCNFAKILSNTLHNTTQDNLSLINCKRNLVEGNTITDGEHALWTLKCSSQNVIRNNYFYNSLQKIGEVFDCDNAGYGSTNYPKLSITDSAQYNLIEYNVFAYTPSPTDASPYSGIQYAGQNGIIRNNLFYNCEGPAISLTLYSGEATFNYGNRILHNVFFNNEYGAISISGNTNYTFHDNIIKNNIFYKNKFIQRDFRWTWFSELDGKPVQILTGRTADFVLTYNNLFNNVFDELYIISYGSITSSNNPSPETLTWWENNYPQTYSNNLQTNPDFVDTANFDFRLNPSSPMIDAGAFLTETVNNGNNSTTMQVVDAKMFTDGYGVITGDTIQLEGQSQYAVITHIEYAAGILTLDTPLTWSAGQGVSRRYNGSAPDLGAFEFSPTTAYNTRNKVAFKVYPNPVSDILYIQTSSPTKATLYNLKGQKIVNTSVSVMNLKNIKPGIYFLQINSSEQSEIFKIVKE